MKISISLSAILVVLPALVAASTPFDARELIGNSYLPRHHARNFGRQRQGAFGGGSRQGQAQGQNHAQGGQNQAQAQGGFHHSGASTTAAASSAAANKNKSKSSTSVAAVTTANTNTAVAAAAASSSTASSKNKDKNKKNTTTAAAAASTDAASSTAAGAGNASSTTSAAAADASVAAASNNNNNNNNDPNTSLNLLPELVETGLEQDGQATQEAGQVPSLTSSNNFINFCAGKTITNGQQITTGSCNPIPMGDIIPKANMPTCKFKNPVNFSTIPANQPFNIEMTLTNLQAGVFTNAQKTYYMAPQQLNNQGILIGHTHFVIQAMGDFADPTILDPATFTFFKGVDTGADGNNIVSVNVTAGVPAGNYRLASINTDANHTPAVAAVAQHGFIDDMIYFTAQ